MFITEKINEKLGCPCQEVKPTAGCASFERHLQAFATDDSQPP